MLNRRIKLAFFRADLAQYNYLIRDEEIREKISTFLLKYISAEGFYKKLLIAEKENNGKKLTDKEKRNLRVVSSDVMRVLDYFGVEYEKEIIERVFGSDESNYMSCSVKKLRDKLVHKANDNVIRAILERYDGINEDVDAFFGFFEKKTA